MTMGITRSSGRPSRQMPIWLRSGMTDTSTPSSSPIRAAHGPAALTTTSASMTPSVVSSRHPAVARPEETTRDRVAREPRDDAAHAVGEEDLAVVDTELALQPSARLERLERRVIPRQSQVADLLDLELVVALEPAERVHAAGAQLDIERVDVLALDETGRSTRRTGGDLLTRLEDGDLRQPVLDEMPGSRQTDRAAADDGDRRTCHRPSIGHPAAVESGGSAASVRRVATPACDQARYIGIRSRFVYAPPDHENTSMAMPMTSQT